MSAYKIGEIICSEGNIIINQNRNTVELAVINFGDRPIQVGSHFHFFEVNKYLKFDREKAFGMRLDIPSGTAVRFEPGEEKSVTLTEYSGRKIMMGFNGLTMGAVNDPIVKNAAVLKAKELGFWGDK